MPHLAPMLWLLAPVLLLMIVLLFTATLWWTTSFKLPTTDSKITTYTFSSWPWD